MSGGRPFQPRIIVIRGFGFPSTFADDVFSEFEQALTGMHRLSIQPGPSSRSSGESGRRHVCEACQRKLVNSIRALPIIKYKPSKDGDKQCKICFNDFGKNEDVRLLPCLHRFHPECIDKWLRQQFKCPICRTSCIQ